ncbi:PREDICTED: vanin-like protein 3 [Papilio polytes]|uniref:vanin-like protein 3 n=1 Tax=Papilio polytes TaxID=76194 RepID=UPI00067600C3|nr:PREDICTED: vanin-like protein 3 [Papilio polytes]
MDVFLKFILLCLCYQSAICKLTYKAAVLPGNQRNGAKDYISQMNKFSNQDVDIVLLASEVLDSETYGKVDCTPDNYDELIRDFSLLAKRFNVYLATHLYQRLQCHSNVEVVKNNLVFDRNGAIVAVYTKPLNNYAKCNVTSQTTFTTDFGVEFLVLMEEDVLLQDLKNLKTQNIIVTGGSADNIVYIKGNQLISSLAYITDVNIISDDGIYIGKGGLKSKGQVLEINKNGKDKHNTLHFNPINIRDLPLEDTNQYIIRPLDVAASLPGYEETVCDGNFCCQFYVKTRSLGTKSAEAHYGLSVYSGVRRMGVHYLGVDSCKLVVCAALYKRTCVLGLESNMNVTFEKISIKGNFTAHHSSQLPVILTTQTSVSSDSFAFVKKLTKHVEVSAELSNVKNILKFGILNRDFTRDYNDNFNTNNTAKSYDENGFYEYILNEDVFEFFDYLWIKVRVLILIVSIYILEMM